MIAPPGVKEVEFDESKLNVDFLNEGWVQVKILHSDDRTQLIKGRIHCQRKQYGLKHSPFNIFNEHKCRVNCYKIEDQS